MKFDKNGKFLMTWGKKGMGPGEFDVPHTLAMDSKGRLFVADRQNNRIQIFDQNGKFIAQWFQFGRPSGMYIDKNDMLYVADSESRTAGPTLAARGMAPTGYGYNLGAERGIRIGSARDGKVKYFIPDPCPYPYAAVRIWRKASPRMPKATSTAPISAAMSENSPRKLPEGSSKSFLRSLPQGMLGDQLRCSSPGQQPEKINIAPATIISTRGRGK